MQRYKEGSEWGRSMLTGDEGLYQAMEKSESGEYVRYDEAKANIDKLERENERLREAVQPLVRVAKGIPDNWPGKCVLTWVENSNGKFGYISYLGVNAKSIGVTIDEYRKAVATLSNNEE